MKALLRKDFYQLKAYCRSILLVSAVFALCSGFSGDNLFFKTYPVVLMGLTPITLLAYDERSKWNCFCAALPLSRAQVVGSKYIMSLLLMLPTVVLILLVSGIRGDRDLLTLALYLIPLGILPCAVCMPIMLRFGVEKGRLFYYILVGLSCAAGFLTKDLPLRLPAILAPGMLLVCAGAFGLSWYLSVKIFEKAEIR